jgi:hypothetical protein
MQFPGIVSREQPRTRSFLVRPAAREQRREGERVLVIKTVGGSEIRIPLHDVASIVEIEPESGQEREIPPHPYLHREGVNRCSACWQPRTHKSHTDQAVHS